MPRQTKIVATLGPSSSTPEILERMIRAGVDVVRLNFSHGTAQDHIERASLVREAAKRAGKEVAIMADLHSAALEPWLLLAERKREQGLDIEASRVYQAALRVDPYCREAWAGLQGLGL